jgi:EAL domain-containing protein (putative c-di-GMP-specific phosphodiesterase class I)
MYHAKRSGKNRSVVYDPVMHTAALARLDLKADLQQALDREELSLVFQPYFAVAGGQLAGFEALIRWTHPVRGMVAPNEFIPLAEETGLIHPIGDWVLREACRQAALWRPVQPGSPAPGINVNVSALQVQESGLADQVNAALLASHLSPERLVLEITESVLLQKAARTVARLEDLRLLGVRIAIDDFGTGYSSLSYLQHLPIDILKIDKSFVDHVGRGQDDASMASVVLQIGRSLRLQVVAEGVEERHQLEALRALGCDLAQGFLLGRPMGAAEAAALCAPLTKN